jgi:UDP-N-acetyl-2-amino-2-deoxyglucuronate dehydrogenase
MSDIPPVTAEKIRLVLVGCGRISDRHLDAAEAIPELEIVAACDELSERARVVGERLGVPAFTSYGAMLAESEAMPR